MSAKPSCFLHIGYPKTGTTTLQNFLAENSEHLISQGILYPHSLRRSEHSPNHQRLVAYALENGRFPEVDEWFGLTDAQDIGRFRAEMEVSLTQELESERGKLNFVICSNEHLAERLEHVTELERLKSFLTAQFARVTVVVYLRRQDRLAVSYYSTALRVGSSEGLNLPEEQSPNGPWTVFDYARVLGPWRDVFGQDAVQVRIYEDCRSALIEDFCQVTGVRLTPSMTKPAPTNLAFSATGQAILRGINRSGLFSSAERWALWRLLDQEYTGQPALPARAETIAWYDRWRGANERVRQEFFPERSAPLFDEDFSEYPLQTSEVQPAFEDALSLIRLLLHEHSKELAAARAPAVRPPETRLARVRRRLRALFHHR